MKKYIQLAKKETWDRPEFFVFIKQQKPNRIVEFKVKFLWHL